MKTSNEMQLARYEYDFSKDGGAQGAIPLRSDVTDIAEGMHIKRMYIIEEESITSGGTPTLTLGNTTDPDGYFADFQALIASKPALMSGEVAGDLLFDDTNDHPIMYSPSSAAADTDLNLTIGTADLTGGKFSLYIEFLAN